jgi:ATP-dependent protease Clp ATPase subunit
MLDLMYDLPSKKDVKQVAITPEVIEKRADPVVTYREKQKTA